MLDMDWRLDNFSVLLLLLLYLMSGHQGAAGE